MKRFIDPNARPAWTGRYRDAQGRSGLYVDITKESAAPARELELTPMFEACIDPTIPDGHIRFNGKLVRLPAEEQELTPEQKAALESWSKRPLREKLKPWQQAAVDEARASAGAFFGPEVVFIPEVEQ